MTTPSNRWTVLMTAGMLPFLALTGCGGDDDAAVDTTATPATEVVDTTDDTAVGSAPDDSGDIDPRYADYCEAARTINDQDEFPTDDQFQALRDTAPDEIRAEVEYVIDRINEAEDQQAVFALFGEPDVMSRMDVIDQFDTENCGIDFGPGNPEGVSLELDPDATRVDVSATEYDFEFEAPPAGHVSFVMSNDGDEPHFLGIGKLMPGVTVEQAIRADDPSEVTEWTADSDVVGPGGEAVLTVADLEPGEYAMVCFIPSPDGEPHAFLGMAVGFTVE
jgi:hypothetical protein